jgi:CRISPR-associated endonuclease/helicase Cas3
MIHDYFLYWGKADPKYPGEPKWHPIVYHCLDVAACGSVLLERQPTWLEVMSRLSGLAAAILRPWVMLQLGLHDIGKFGDGFQSMRPELHAALSGRAVATRNTERHTTLGYLLTQRYLLDWLGQDGRDPDLLDLVQPWLAAATGHHGRPPKNVGNPALLLRDQFPANVANDTQRFVEETGRLFMPEGFPLPAPEAGLAERYMHTSWLLAGLLVVADWLGSNTRWFSYREPTLSLIEYWHQVALTGAHRAVDESGLPPATPAPFAGFKALFANMPAPTPMQVWSESVRIGQGPQLFILEELTGSGKTEAALVLAGRLLESGHGEGVYLALPTMATADGMFDRLRKDDLWRRFFASAKPSLALAHSASDVKLRLEELNRKERDPNRDEETTASQDCATWLADSRKKALLADFGVGTIDQALIGVLPIRHQSLRLLGLSTKVLVVDEVHACDAYMGELLARLLTFHAALGGSAILLSATLPHAQRAKYINAFANGLSLKRVAPEKRDYPLATHFSTDGLDEEPVDAREEVSRTVAVTSLTDELAVFQWLWRAVAQGRCVVWVRNTVADAVASWREWNTAYPDCRAVLYHARFALSDRIRIGKEIGAAFGPDSASDTRRGRLVIATQVIEQSLDVDFDDMVTDLAPIDLVIQRAGRLQRHVRDAHGNRIRCDDRRDGRGGARLAVLTPEASINADKAWPGPLLAKTGYVYPDRGWLWLTAKWLREHATYELPRQARDMIEVVYDEDSFEALPESLRVRSQQADGDRRAARGAARGALLVFDEGYSPTSRQWEDEIETPTRLADDPSVRIRLARSVGDNLTPWAVAEDASLAWQLSDLSVPHRMIGSEISRLEAVIQRAKAAMPDEGRHVLVVLLRAVDEDLWRGSAVNGKGDEIAVAYSPVVGLTLEKGVLDESDI